MQDFTLSIAVEGVYNDLVQELLLEPRDEVGVLASPRRSNEDFATVERDL